MLEAGTKKTRHDILQKLQRYKNDLWWKVSLLSMALTSQKISTLKSKGRQCQGKSFPPFDKYCG